MTTLNPEIDLNGPGQEVSQLDLLEEIETRLYQLERCFLDLEASKGASNLIEDASDLLKEVSPSLHRLNGESLNILLSQMDSLFLKIKNKDLPIHTHLMNLLLNCTDQILKNVELLKKSEPALGDYSELIHELGQVLTSQLIQGEASPADEMEKVTKDYLSLFSNSTKPINYPSE